MKYIQSSGVIPKNSGTAGVKYPFTSAWEFEQYVSCLNANG